MLVVTVLSEASKPGHSAVANAFSASVASASACRSAQKTFPTMTWASRRRTGLVSAIILTSAAAWGAGTAASASKACGRWTDSARDMATTVCSVVSFARAPSTVDEISGESLAEGGNAARSVYKVVRWSAEVVLPWRIGV